jgi:four helix bundle protein
MEGDMTVREPAKTFEQLIVWQKAHGFVLDAYRLAEGFPKWEMFGLSGQLRRAAVSIPANIAEGFKRRGTLDKARFLNIAEGSLEECRYYLILARDLKYEGDIEQAMSNVCEVSRLPSAYTRGVLNGAARGSAAGDGGP